MGAAGSTSGARGGCNRGASCGRIHCRREGIFEGGGLSMPETELERAEKRLAQARAQRPSAAEPGSDQGRGSSTRGARSSSAGRSSSWAARDDDARAMLDRLVQGPRQTAGPRRLRRMGPGGRPIRCGPQVGTPLTRPRASSGEGRPMPDDRRPPPSDHGQRLGRAPHTPRRRAASRAWSCSPPWPPPSPTVSRASPPIWSG